MGRTGALLLGVLVLGLLVVVGAQAPAVEEYSVFIDRGLYRIAKGKSAAYIAVAQVQNNPNVTGWATLDISTNPDIDDYSQAYAAGYIEGALTTDLIYNSWMNQLEFFYNSNFNQDVAAWVEKNDMWVREQVANCVQPTEECDYWYQVGLVINQLDGMAHGYNQHCDPNKTLAYDIFLYINVGADYGDILAAINPSLAAKNPLQFLEKDHCSVLVKYSQEAQQVYHSHTTWGHYVNMLRSFKHYNFNFNHNSTASKTVSFSSFPAFIASGDDYFITDAGLIVTETTNNVFNMSLYQYVQPTTVLYWIRVVVANRMANNGKQWVSIFAKYNSGTYNNQWQVSDTKLFAPSQTSFQNGTLVILEQIPGYCVSDDVTFFLNEQGFFPSYNVPYFDFIYTISGYPSMKAQFGDAYSYESCPRANIFRRDQGKVVTLEDMQNIMRYNEYQTDPLSLGDSCNGISARCDLNTTTYAPFGGSDCKISTTQLIKNMQTTALSGPTTVSQPPFSWTGPFADIPHWGQPTLFNFSFELMQPQALCSCENILVDFSLFSLQVPANWIIWNFENIASTSAVSPPRDSIHLIYCYNHFFAVIHSPQGILVCLSFTEAPSFSCMSVVTNLTTYDPFADTEAEGGNKSANYVHIRIQQRTGRKALTTLSGLPSDLDFKKILKAFKKEFCCNGTIVDDETLGKVIQLQGDQRKNCSQFLITEGIVDKSLVKIHGF